MITIWRCTHHTHLFRPTCLIINTCDQNWREMQNFHLRMQRLLLDRCELVDRCGWFFWSPWLVVGSCGSLWIVVGCCGVVVGRCGVVGSLWGRSGSLWGRSGSLWVVVGRCGSLWGRCGSLWVVVDCSGSLWVVVDRCGSLWVVPCFSNYGCSVSCTHTLSKWLLVLLQSCFYRFHYII